MKYDDFEKNFYDESEEIANMTEEEIANYRTSLGIKVHGVDTIRPIKTFAHFGFDDLLMKKIKEAVSIARAEIFYQFYSATKINTTVVGL